jgi:hypothetical protein
MGSYVSKQPNGLYCRFSSVVDCPTDWNMTAEDYIEMCAEKAREEAREVLAKHLQPFDRVMDDFSINNMTEKQFNKFLRDVGYKKTGGGSNVEPKV